MAGYAAAADPDRAMQKTVASVIASPRAAGGSRVPERSPGGTTVQPKLSCDGRRAAWLTKRSTSAWSRLEAGEVHDGLDENGVIANVGVLPIQLRQRAEERAAAGDVHLTHGPLKGGGGDVGAKSIDDVLPVALVQQH